MKPAIDDDVEDYFAMQERKTAKGNGAPAAPNCAIAAQLPPPPTEDLDMTVEEAPGEFGPDTIVEKINRFWDR